MKCGRCKQALTNDTAEFCWWCEGWLCLKCFEEFGHCGHPEADEENLKAKFADK